MWGAVFPSRSDCRVGVGGRLRSDQVFKVVFSCCIENRLGGWVGQAAGRPVGRLLLMPVQGADRPGAVIAIATGRMWVDARNV